MKVSKQRTCITKSHHWRHAFPMPSALKMCKITHANLTSSIEILLWKTRIAGKFISYTAETCTHGTGIHANLVTHVKSNNALWERLHVKHALTPLTMEVIWTQSKWLKLRWSLKLFGFELTLKHLQKRELLKYSSSLHLPYKGIASLYVIPTALLSKSYHFYTTLPNKTPNKNNLPNNWIKLLLIIVGGLI